MLPGDVVDADVAAGVSDADGDLQTRPDSSPRIHVRQPRPESNLARAHEFVREHLDTHAPADIRRMMAEQLGLKPTVANTYFYQARNLLNTGPALGA